MPVLSASIRSRRPPIAQAMTGSPAAIASMAPLGKASERDGSTKTSASDEQRGDVFAVAEELDVAAHP